MERYRSDAIWILSALLVGLVLLLLIVGGYATATKGVAAGAGGALIVVSSCAIGLLFGLLFGAPHSSGQSPSDGQGLLSLNTSFDQMSDWLTKILVGVGLTQLVGLPSRLQTLGNYLAPAVGGGDTSASVATTLALGSAVLGFLISFVFTKLILSPDLAAAGYDTVRNGAQRAVSGNPAARQLPSKDRQLAVNFAEDLARKHLARGEQVTLLDATAWNDIADQAIQMVKEGKKPKPGATVGGNGEKH